MEFEEIKSIFEAGYIAGYQEDMEDFEESLRIALDAFLDSYERN